jgi:filamentous hemagglutinin
VGRYAEKKQTQAARAAAKEADPALREQYRRDAENWAEGGKYRAALHVAGGALTGGLTGGGLGAAGGAAGAGLSAALAPKLDEIARSIAGAGPTGNRNVDELLGNLTSNVLSGAAGTLAGGGAGALGSAAADRFNRQLSPDERQWASDDAEQFAKRYEEKTGKSLTAEQARDMLLGTGYRMVDEMASKGPGGDPIAAAYISEHGGDMFRATPGEYKDPFLYGNADNSLTPEQKALPGSTANPVAGLVIAGGLVTAGLGPELAAGTRAAASYAQDFFAAYKASQAGYSLTTAAATGAGVSGGIYSGSALVGAGVDWLHGAGYSESFDQRFSMVGLGTSAIFGAYSNMFTVSMFKWAEVPNTIKNATAAPGIVIRGTKLALGQTAGRAAQAMTDSHDSNKQ